MRPSLKTNANFRWLMAGGILSMLGDQFTLIALPWLVLMLTGDPLSLGLVLALLGAPRAIFILLGGALVDRYSPQRVFMLTKYASALLLGALAALTLAGAATLPLVYALSLGIGLAQAFAYPSGSSIMPRAIPPELLQAANGALMGVRQVGMLAGPLLAALLLAMGGHAGGGPSGMFALGLAFAFDSLTFLVSAWTLSKVAPLPGAPQAVVHNVLRAVGEGLLAVWRDVEMRTCFAYWGLVSVLIGGTMQVALPVLAKERLHDGSAFGMLMAAHGAGMLAGMAFSGMSAKRHAGKPLRIGLLALGVDAMAGLLVIPLGLITAAWQGGVLLLSLGALVGLVQVAVFTWIQKRVQPQMMGRTMSIFMFILFGLAPLSSAATGWIMLHVTLPQMFAGAGAVLVLCATLALLFTPMRRIVTA
ncbi:MFS transporter [Pseudoduganella sp. DS3]|uniref:MFS transporter n=1 Tax=Pseudoduganella guangdongensis TaxID=2692179 RepID=A0A6N9HF80_9BURK|nr:MFS transporter [Pseudoduganella guangdongensis]MYN02194.1 MFS transporter [Pseudoduganella guangdongensis]